VWTQTCTLSNMLTTYCFFFSDTSAKVNNGEGKPTAINLTLYVYIEKPLLPWLKEKPSESNKYVQKGPFKHKLMDTYSKFLVSISVVLPCPVLNIIEAKITWKCQTPQNLPSLPLGGETSYSTMIEALQAKRAGSQVGIIMMPLPVKTVEWPVCVLCVFFAIIQRCLSHLQHWDVENTEKVNEKTFDYGELDAHMGTTDDAISQQQVSPLLVYLLISPSLTWNF